MRRDYEYIVLGLGGLGSAAAYWLARSGGQVLGLEQFELGHERGESEDHSRIIRLSYHTPGYVKLAQQAYEAWAEMEGEAGERVILKTGGLDFGPRQGAINLQNYADSMAAAGVEFEWLETAEIQRRWPAFRLGDDIRGLYQADGGIAMAGRANRAHRRLALAHGAVLRDRCPVWGIRTPDGEVEVQTADGAYRCRRLVIASGPWSNQTLAHLGLQLPLEVTQEQVTYFDTPHQQQFAPERFPVWIWMDDPCFYGFPVFGEKATKAGQDAGGRVVTADSRSFEPDPDCLSRLQTFLERYLPDFGGPILRTKTCLYTLTPDRDFVIDRLADGRVCVAIGAGHAYKFCSLIGRCLAELASSGQCRADLSPFRLNRAILLEEKPPRSYMV